MFLFFLFLFYLLLVLDWRRFLCARLPEFWMASLWSTRVFNTFFEAALGRVFKRFPINHVRCNVQSLFNQTFLATLEEGRVFLNNPPNTLPMPRTLCERSVEHRELCLQSFRSLWPGEEGMPTCRQCWYLQPHHSRRRDCWIRSWDR